MLKIKDKIFSKNEILFIEKVDSSISGRYLIRIHFKNENIICQDVEFENRKLRDEYFDLICQDIYSCRLSEFSSNICHENRKCSCECDKHE